MQVGDSSTVTHVVTEADTATAFGSGDVDVLGTPKVVALVEAATVAAIAGQVTDTETTVGAHVDLEHLRPTRVGAAVTAEATLREVDGNRLVFDVRLLEEGRLVARGTVTRVLVDRARFNAAR